MEECIYYHGCYAASLYCESCDSGPCCESCYADKHLVKRFAKNECVKCTRIASKRNITNKELVEFLLTGRESMESMDYRYKQHMLETKKWIEDPCDDCTNEGCRYTNAIECVTKCCVCNNHIPPCDHCREKMINDK